MKSLYMLMYENYDEISCNISDTLETKQLQLIQIFQSESLIKWTLVVALYYSINTTSVLLLLEILDHMDTLQCLSQKQLKARDWTHLVTVEAELTWGESTWGLP